MNYRLDQIAHVIHGTLTGDGSRTITDCSIDSRSLVFAAPTLFFALTGPHHNGHDYIPALYQKGVRAFVVSQLRDEFRHLPDISLIRVDSPLDALQALAAHHRNGCAATIIGITGSNGKTIVKEWLYQLLSPEGALYRSPRSYNSQVGVPLSLLGIEADHRLALIEAGISQPGEMSRLETMIRPHIGIFTHAGEAHGENFTSDTEKITEKACLFRHCHTLIGRAGQPMELIRSLCPQATLWLWSETEHSPRFASPHFVSVRTQHTGKDHRSVTIQYRDLVFPLEIPFGDDASYENILHTVTCLLALGIPPETIAQRVARLTPIAMRMEIKEGINDCLLIQDYYNSDPDSFRLALSLLKNQDPAREPVVILSDFVDTGKAPEQLYPQIGQLICQAGIHRFYGIGVQLSRYRSHFPGTSRFYEETSRFLQQENRESFRHQVILIKGARRFRFEYIAGFLQKQSHGTLLEVDMDAMVHNLNHFRSLTPARIAVMVKAFSYGSGGREIATLLQYHGVDYLMVAFADEGIGLRAAGITLPIAVMNPEREAFDSMITFGLEPEIYDLALLADFEKQLVRHGVEQFPIHIKLNTGMNRSGFDAEEIPRLLDFFSVPRITRIRSLFSHLAASDDPGLDPFTHEQFQRFEQMTGLIQARLSYPIWRHILNSAGIERFPRYHYDMVRLGIGLHGISATDAPLRTVSRFTSHIASIRTLSPGETVGYSRKGIIRRPSRIAIIPAGYADGINRHLSNGSGEVYVAGSRVPIIGNISMDSCAIDITDTDARIGDPVELFGEHIPVREWADKLDTIPYEILTGISQRVKRIYYRE